MTISQDSKQLIEVVAKNTLSIFEKIAGVALSKLRDAPAAGAEVLASVNTLTSPGAVRSLEQISRENRDSYQQLINEPAIARIVVVDGAGKKSTYYICRATPISLVGGEAMLASYRSPVGRLASLPVGGEFPLPQAGGSVTVEVLERAQLHPAMIDQEWDSRNSVLEGDDYGPVTVESLRALLMGIPAEDLLERLLAEETATANVREGIRRSVITKMGLRDQPILDRFQDEIFRLPLDSRLLILGAPGTGKTTTLIRRLGQKLDLAFLDEDERDTVNRAASGHARSHEQSWLMFTPTELLKQYVKEAFAREGIAASDQRIRTWSDYRRELARNVFGMLRTASGSGSFVVKEAADILGADAKTTQSDLFSDFNAWHASVFWDATKDAAHSLRQNPANAISALGKKLLSIVENAGSASTASVFVSLNAAVGEVQSLIDGRKKSTDKEIRDALTLQVNRNRKFLDDLAAFIDRLADIDDEPDDQDIEEEEDVSQPKTGLAGALSAYMRAARAQARAQANKRTLRKTTRNGRIAEWLGDRSLLESKRSEVGESLLVQSAAQQFVNPVKRYIDGIPRRYRSFRRLCQSGGRWYRNEGFGHTDIHPLELDVVLLAVLRSAGELINEPRILRNIDNPFYATLKPIWQLYKNQVLVDEATDFSPVQLACMAAMSHPGIRSFFACGDFNQRVTTWGSRSVDDVKWALRDIEIKSISVSYRQSRQLNELAKQIVALSGRDAVEVVLPAQVNNEGVAPVLAEGMSEHATIVDWLAHRIVEIESLIMPMPSTAIFVNGEDKVQLISKSLNEALINQNTRVVACPNGQVMGQENDVRVFDVQHIKGLEFEVVFFIGIDQLANDHPDIFDNYLYVGATRAAIYLGMTCEGELPRKLVALKQLFGENWQ